MLAFIKVVLKNDKVIEMLRNDKVVAAREN